jgi:hypothetical protein
MIEVREITFRPGILARSVMEIHYCSRLLNGVTGRAGGPVQLIRPSDVNIVWARRTETPYIVRAVDQLGIAGRVP